MLIRKENKIVRNKSCMRRHFESSGDMIETLDDLQEFLDDYCDGDISGDITSKKGLCGVHDPDVGFMTMDLRASKSGSRTIVKGFVFDTNKIDWDGFVDDVVSKLKHKGSKISDTSIHEEIYEMSVDYALNDVDDKSFTEYVGCLVLPVSEEDVRVFVRYALNDNESEIVEYAEATFYDEIKDSL